MKCLLATQSLRPDIGGPAYSVLGIGRALAAHGVNVFFVTSDGSHVPLGLPPAPEQWRNFDIIHSFGLWTPFSWNVARKAARSGTPQVISPIGMLEPWALDQKRFKKRLAWLFYQSQTLRRAAALHATSRQEAASLFKLGLSQVYVAPHGIDLPPNPEIMDKDRCKHRKTALFLSRLHAKKGLADLVQAWGRLRPRGWRLLIAGPDTDGYWRHIAKLISSQNLDKEICYLGAVYDDRKRETFNNADLFILPTYSENFGLVVGEAMSHGLPVITTTGAPWPELRRTGSGWWVEPGLEPLVNVLREATSLSRQELRQMGARGRKLVESEFDWNRVSLKHLRAYEQIRATCPAAIGSPRD